MKLKSTIHIFILTAIGGWYCYHFMYGSRGIKNYLVRIRKLEKQEKKNTELTKHVEELKQKINNITHDDFYKEKIAREKLNLAHSDDIVFSLYQGILTAKTTS